MPDAGRDAERRQRGRGKRGCRLCAAACERVTGRSEKRRERGCCADRCVALCPAERGIERAVRTQRADVRVAGRPTSGIGERCDGWRSESCCRRPAAKGKQQRH